MGVDGRNGKRGENDGEGHIYPFWDITKPCHYVSEPVRLVSLTHPHPLTFTVPVRKRCEGRLEKKQSHLRR